MTPSETTEVFFTYWRHPESDCVLAIPSNELSDAMDGNLVELDLEQYLNQVKSPDELPPGVRGILKNADWWPLAINRDVIIGDLWFDPKKQFPDGINITTSRIQDIRSDGIYKTLHSMYFVQFKEGVKR